MKARSMMIPLAAFMLLSCTNEREMLEQTATQLNIEARNEAYARYRSRELAKYEEFMSHLNKAAKAEFCRVRGDCCCTGAELPPAKGTKLTQNEFAELKDILKQGQQLPLKKREDIPCTEAIVTDDESGKPKLDWLHVGINVELNIGSLHIVDRLVLQDEKGKEIHHISFSSGIVKSNEKTTGDAVLLLPDELYERYRKHPARQRFANNIRKAHEKAGIPHLGD